MLLSCAVGFHHNTFFKTSLGQQANIRTSQATALSLSTQSPDTATTAAIKSRLKLSVTGPSVGNALFRAELKKELVFFRGCGATFHHEGSANGGIERVDIVCEGKTAQLKRFMEWLNVLGTELNTRKPSFQGPAMIVKVTSTEWTDFVGDISGFEATSCNTECTDEPPVLFEGAQDVKTLEAKSMTGTDESV